MTIAFDAAAAWEMRRRGWEPEEWLGRLRESATGHLEDGRAWISWRQIPDGGPPGQWFSRMELTVVEGGDGHVRFDPIAIGVARYMQDQTEGKGPRSGAVMIPGPLPDTLISGMIGRPLGAVVDFEPLRDTPIIDANNFDVAGRMFTAIAVEPVRERIATPMALLP